MFGNGEVDMSALQGKTFGEYVPADLEALAKARGSSSLTGTAEEAYALQSDVTRRWEPS